MDKKDILYFIPASGLRAVDYYTYIYLYISFIY